MVLPMISPFKHPKTDVYQIRKVVPQSLRPIVGQRELHRSLGTKDPVEAKRRAPAVIAEFEEIIAAARSGQAPAVAATSKPGMSPPTLPAEASGPTRSSETTLQALRAECVLSDWAQERNPSTATLKKYRASFKQVAIALGFDDLRRITANDVSTFKKARLDAGRDQGTVADDIMACGAVVAWACVNGLLPGNPFQGKAPRAIKRGVQARIGYDDKDAATILLAARKKTGCLRWLPWILAFTGCRLSEIAELRRKDIRQEDGVWIFDLRPTEIREGKNVSFQRMIPIHPELEVEGFIKHVLNHPGPADGPLFHDVPTARDGTRTTAIQSRHARWLEKVIGEKDARKAPAHAWRHRMEDELRKIRVPDEVHDAITGRKNPRNEGANYGRGYRGMPAEVLIELRKVPSPLHITEPQRETPVSVPQEIVDRPLPPMIEVLRDALASWFERRRTDAYRLFSSGSFAAASLPADANERSALAHNRDMTHRDAADRIDLLAEAYRAGEFEQGHAHVRMLANTLGREIPKGTQIFDILSVWFMEAEAIIEEARMRWAANEINFIPSAPKLGNRHLSTRAP